MAITTYKRISEISNGISSDEYEYIGVRVQEETYGLSVGDTVEHKSKHWIDGEMTEEYTRGVCAISAEYARIRSIGDFGGYPGKTILVLGSNYAEGGEDIGEIVLVDPVVLDIIQD